MRGYWKLKEEALDHTLKRTCLWERLWIFSKTDFKVSECLDVQLVEMEPNDTIYRFRSFSSDSGEISFGGSTRARIRVRRRSRASAKFSC